MDAVLHTVVLLALLTAYTVLTALGYDGNPLLAVGGAYGLGAGVQKAATA